MPTSFGFSLQTRATYNAVKDELSNVLISSLPRLYSSGEYSDLVISCREKEYQVHRAMVYIQSQPARRASRQLVHIIIHYFYRFDYDIQVDGDGADIKRLDAGALATHTRIYALAEKYLIRGLKTVAVRKFKAEVTIAYTSAIEDDRGLRDVVVETLYNHPHWLDKEEVRDVMKELGPLMYDFIIYVRQKGRI
ncbi:uncharacterized protein B0T15DRAFT_486366 [Chaetomium strumarium]|uniref:BTB domain-containing protein n=1 Tax=Chaetomium strumarium TaxID=1170767 RepID=A0AAJ0GRR0_9PEZI|nr:hypothetical protein B0T15DRAFT_486366 [Chaetomium strumarium]